MIARFKLKFKKKSVIYTTTIIYPPEPKDFTFSNLLKFDFFLKKQKSKRKKGLIPAWNR